ncbi:MAG: hypothetical protein ACJ788_10295 [Ktedonobacteraceae bacterium]
MKQLPNDQPDWQQPQYPGQPPQDQPSYPQQPSQANWPPQQSGQLPPQYPQQGYPQFTQYPQQPPYQQTGPGMPPPQWQQPYPYQQTGMPPQYPMPPQQPPRQPDFFQRKVGCLPMWAILLIIALFACAGASFAAKSGSNATTENNPPDIAATNSAQLAATNCAATTNDSSCSSYVTPVLTATIDTSIPTSTPVPTQAPAKWTTTHNYKGSGIKKTDIFTVPDDWKITWSCNPSSFYGSQYNVQVYVYNSDGSIADVAINALCKSGNTSGETEEHQGGDVYLDINSEADWTIKVQEFK